MSEIEVLPPQVTGELTVAIRDNALDAPAAQTVLDAYTPFYTRAKKLVAQASFFLNDDAPDAKIARTLRLALKDERIAAEKTRKGLNENAVRFTKAVNGVNAVILLLIEPMEARLDAIEKAEAIAEAGRRASIKGAREELLRPFKVDTQFYALETMPDAAFDRLLADTQLAYEAKVAAALNAEAERILAERAAAAEKLAKENAEAEARALVEAENARLKAERDAIEAQATEDREKAAKAAKEAAARARRAREEIEAKAKAEREEIEAKAAAEREAAAAAAKVAADEKAALQKFWDDKVAADKAAADLFAAESAKLAAAPDREKITAFADLIAGLPLPDMSTPNGKAVGAYIAEQIADLVEVIRATSNRL